MSFSIAALSPIDPSLNKVDPIHELDKVANNNSNNSNPTPKPTELEKIAQLAETGTPLAVIATKLGLSLSEVEDRLGVKADVTAAADAVAAASTRLSVTA